MRGVEFHGCAILAAKGRLALEGITELTLEGPFAQRVLRGVGIESREGVGLLLGEGWQVVDECCRTCARTLAAEGHVFAAFGLQQEAHAALGVRAREHQRVAATIDIAIVKRWVLTLERVFGHQTIVTFLKLCANVNSAHVCRQIEFVGTEDVCAKLVLCARGAEVDDVFAAFVLRDGTHAERQAAAVFVHTLEPLVHVEFKVCAVYPGVRAVKVGEVFVPRAVVPIHALLSGQGFQRDALHGL